MIPFHHRRVLRSRLDSNQRMSALQAVPLNHLGTGPIVTPQGLEPQLSGPKPLVLPLDERVICWKGRTRTYDTPRIRRML